MSRIRPQYHFRTTENGLDAWDVRRLIELSAHFPIFKVGPGSLEEIHSNHWYKEAQQIPSPNSILEHIQLIDACDLSYPIILDAQGNVMDGMHRICKALLTDIKEIDAVQFQKDPEPDFKNCNSKDLPYAP